MKIIRLKFAVIAIGISLLGGCASQPEKTASVADVSFRQQRIKEYRHSVDTEQKQVPLRGALTLPQAIARAIKYNLDHRVKQMETMVAMEHVKLARLSYLPEIVAMAGYSSRNNYSGGISRSLDTGDVSLEASTSQEKNHTLSSLRASWDIVDFGLAYYTVQQKKDSVAIAREQRRKVIQNIIQDVQEAYWRTYISQQLSARIRDILQESEVALRRFKRLANSGKIDPRQGLKQQREILQVRYRVRSLQEQLAAGPLHLAALLNLPPGYPIRLSSAAVKLELPELASSATQFENLALLNRPELRIEDSKLKITNADIRKSMLEMFPHLELWGQISHDSNEYLHNNNWSEVGAQLTLNLLDGGKSYGRYEVYKTERGLAISRHRALSMAVIAQVHLALNRYSLARFKYLDSSELQQVSDRFATFINRDTFREAEEGFAKIQANLQAAATEMETMLSYAEGQNALMRLYNTVGLDPLAKLDETSSIDEMASVLEAYLQDAAHAIE